jgi:WD40 repeat protein
MIPLLLLVLAADPLRGSPADADEPLPPHAIVRFGPQRFHLGGEAGTFAVSPDGRRVAFPGAGVAWSTVTGREDYRFLQTQPVSYCAYSPDGRTLAVGGFFAPARGTAQIVLIDAATGRETAQFAGHRGEIDFVAFAGGRTLVSAGRDALFRVWDLQTGAEIRQFPRPGEQYPKAEAVSPDGRYLACVDPTDFQPAPLHLYEIATGRELVKEILPRSARDLAFAPDGRSLAVRGLAMAVEGSAMRWYELPSGREKARWRLPEDQLHGTLACSNGGPYLLTASGDRLTAYDVAAGRTAEFPLRLPICMARQPAAIDLLITTFGTRLEVWDLKTGRPRHPTTGHTQPIAGVALTPDGHAVTADAGSVHRWDAAGREEQVWHCRSGYGIYASALTPDGRILANGSGGVVRLWDTATGRQTGSVAGSVNVDCALRFAPDGRMLAYPGWQSLPVWDTTAACQLWDAPATGQRYTAVAFTPDGRTVVSGDQGGAIREWDVASGQAIRQLEGHPEFMERPGQPFRRIEPRPGHMGSVVSLAVSPDGRRLVSAGGDRTLRVWELATGKECALLERATGARTAVYPAPHYPMAFSPDGALLAIPGQDGDRRQLIDLWDIRAGRRLTTLDGHRGPVTALAFAPDGRRLISGGMDTVALVWEVPPRPREPAAAPAAAQADALWADLADADAAKAYRALGAWLAAPESAVATFRRLRPPTQSVDAERVRRLIADLDSDQYAVREKASNELRALGPAAGEPLRRALAKSHSVEAGRRIEAVLAGCPDEDLRGRRAVEVLEAAGTPAARALLTEWAKGDPAAAPTREATAALTRLGRP